MSRMESLEPLVLEIIRKYHETEASGNEAEVIHLDVTDLKIDEPERLEGRHGVFEKVNFEYVLVFMASNALEEDDPVRYKQSIRLDGSGTVTAVSEPTEIWT